STRICGAAVLTKRFLICGGAAAPAASISPLLITFSRLETRYLSHPKYALAYPKLVYSGEFSQAGRHGSFLFCNISSPDTFPGCAVMLIDTLGEMSEPVVCTLGTFPLGWNEDREVWRWGDYSGMVMRDTGEVWMAGYTTREANRNFNWISQAYNEAVKPLPFIVIGPDPVSEERVVAYPNPTTEILNLLFEVPEKASYQVYLYDLRGNDLGKIVEATLEPGQGDLTFSTRGLASGVYVLSVRSGEREVKTLKFVQKQE
ncbi:MAG: T9SS type A sorting domain-containing protein, partial [Bacteroidota bacterium]